MANRIVVRTINTQDGVVALIADDYAKTYLEFDTMPSYTELWEAVMATPEFEDCAEGLMSDGDGTLLIDSNGCPLGERVFVLEDITHLPSPVGEITCDDPDAYYGEGQYVLKAEFKEWLDRGTKLYTHPQPAEAMVDAAIKVFEDAGAKVDLGRLGEACRAYVTASFTPATAQQSKSGMVGCRPSTKSWKNCPIHGPQPLREQGDS